MDQSALIQSAQLGNLEAFNQLVLLHQERVFSTAVYMLNSEDSAADALQNALLLAYHNITHFRGGSFQAWLLRILKNVCYDELRRQKRHVCLALEPLSDDADDFDTPHWLADPTQNPAGDIENQDLTRAIQSSLQTLAPEYRLALILVDVDGLDYDEAAAAMGVPMGTVKSRLARARLKMRGKLQHYGDLLPDVYTRGALPAMGMGYAR